MAIDPQIKIQDLEIFWTKGICSICRETCDPEGYLHSQCATTRYDFLDAQRKAFWADWIAKQKEKKK